MPTIAPGLTISDSLKKLVLDHSPKIKCCKLLADIFARLENSRAASEGCPCPECRRARKKTSLLNEKPIGDYFSFRDGEKEGMISYCPKGKTQVVNEDGTWARKGRVCISPAKWIKSLIHPKLAKRYGDHVYSEMSTVVKAEEQAQRIDFKFVPFGDAYDSKNYGDNPPGSCMWGADVGPFYRLVGAKAIVAVDGKGVYRARAVFWPNVKLKNGELIQFLDRIYTASPEITQLLCAHAKKQGWHHKSKQSRSSFTGVVSPQGKELSYVMTVVSEKEIPCKGSYFYPYLDTFSGGLDEYTLINQNNHGDNSSLRYLYQSTNGVRETLENHEGMVEDRDGIWQDEDDCVMVGDYFFLKTDSRIFYCHHSEEWYSAKYKFFVAHKGIFIHRQYEGSYPPPAPTAEEKAAKAKKDREEKMRLKKQAEQDAVCSKTLMDMYEPPSYSRMLQTSNVAWAPISINFDPAGEAAPTVSSGAVSAIDENF